MRVSEQNSLSLCASGYLKKYHEESTKVSIVSYSGTQPSPKIFSVLSFNSFESANGEIPVGLKSTSVGSNQGRYSLGINLTSPSGE